MSKDFTKEDVITNKKTAIKELNKFKISKAGRRVRQKHI